MAAPVERTNKRGGGLNKGSGFVSKNKNNSGTLEEGRGGGCLMQRGKKVNPKALQIGGKRKKKRKFGSMAAYRLERQEIRNYREGNMFCRDGREKKGMGKII